MTEVRIKYAPNKSNIGMNLWLTQICGLVYRKDWFWEHTRDEFVYKFVSESDAATFALKWS